MKALLHYLHGFMLLRTYIYDIFLRLWRIKKPRINIFLNFA